MREKQIILFFIKIMKFLTINLASNPGQLQLRLEVKEIQYQFKIKPQ